MRDHATNTYGGGVDITAVIGHAPESRGWRPGCPVYRPAIHPTARIEAHVSVDSGLEAPTVVSAGAWLMKKVHIGHDAFIGQDCELAPGCVVGGHAVIEPSARLGIGALVLPHRVVGAGATVGAGAVVVHDVPPGAVVAGNPARVITTSHQQPHTSRPAAARQARGGHADA